MANKYEEVGYVMVDAGVLQVGDPCYQFDDHDKWLQYIEHTGLLSNKEDTTIVRHDSGVMGKAIIVGGFGGDGVFPVYIKRDSKTGLVKEIKIKFS